jgi:predicted RNA-binding protein
MFRDTDNTLLACFGRQGVFFVVFDVYERTRHLSKRAYIEHTPSANQTFLYPCKGIFKKVKNYKLLKINTLLFW